MKLDRKEAKEYWSNMPDFEQSEILKTHSLPYNYEPDETELEGMVNQYLSNSYIKEIAFLCSFMTSANYLNGSVFSSFDKYYEIAEAFVKAYPLNTKWGIDDLEYEETIESFTLNYINKNSIRI